MIELVIVVVIIGIIAAIAIPRMSRGVSGASNSALRGDLATLRKALDLYQAEHNGEYPKLAKLPGALTQYSDEAGTDFADDKNAPTGRIFGPYLREIPPLPVGPNKGETDFTNTLGTADTGWVYDEDTGVIKPNIPALDKDDSDILYSDY